MAPVMDDNDLINGGVYFAAFREKDQISSPSYVVAAIYPTGDRGNLTWNRMIEIAFDKGKSIFTKKMLLRG